MSRLMPAPSDARAFTSYLSAGQREETLQRALGVRSEAEYRMYLQHNSQAVASKLKAAYTGLKPPPMPSAGRK